MCLPLTSTDGVAKMFSRTPMLWPVMELRSAQLQFFEGPSFRTLYRLSYRGRGNLQHFSNAPRMCFADLLIEQNVSHSIESGSVWSLWFWMGEKSKKKKKKTHSWFFGKSNGNKNFGRMKKGLLVKYRFFKRRVINCLKLRIRETACPPCRQRRRRRCRRS